MKPELERIKPSVWSFWWKCIFEAVLYIPLLLIGDVNFYYIPLLLNGDVNILMRNNSSKVTRTKPTNRDVPTSVICIQIFSVVPPSDLSHTGLLFPYMEISEAVH